MKNKKIEKLEAIRGFAAFYVVLFHLLPQKILLFGINIGFLFRFGSEAVIMFFILSGFVIKYTWENSSDKSFKKYFFEKIFTDLYSFDMHFLISVYFKMLCRRQFSRS